MTDVTARVASSAKASARCDQCGHLVTGQLTATGHIIGAHYRSGHHGMTYAAAAGATLWELAPEQAVRRDWENGNVTISDESSLHDTLLCLRCIARGCP